MTAQMSVPLVVLPEWKQLTSQGHAYLWRQTLNGMQVTLADEAYTTVEDGPPLGRPGRYRRVVLSRPDRYPGWNEMRDFIRTCGYFDRDRDVFMLLPPDKRYVNHHPNCFHWFQELEASR